MLQVYGEMLVSNLIELKQTITSKQANPFYIQVINIAAEGGRKK